MADPKVSIAIPVYNREHLVRHAIESALAQTYADIEVVIVDNCSTDATYEAVQKYACADSRVRCYRNERDIGPVANWLRCAELSRGQYTKILFSDDWMEPNAVERLLQPFREGLDIAFVFSGVYGHLAGEPAKVWFSRVADGLLPALDFLWDFVTAELSTVPVSPCAALFRRSDVLSSIELKIPNGFGLDFNRYGVGNDALMFWRCCEKYPYVYHIRDPLIHFTEPVVDEPCFSQSLVRSGQGYVVWLGYQIAFAHFLATSTLPPRTKRLLHTAMFVQRLPARPWLLMEVISEFGRLFPNGYNWWHLRFLEPRILGLMKKRLNSIVRRVIA